MSECSSSYTCDINETRNKNDVYMFFGMCINIQIRIYIYVVVNKCVGIDLCVGVNICIEINICIWTDTCKDISIKNTKNWN